MYRLIEAHVVTADDSNQSQITFNRTCSLTQTKDLEAASPTVRVAPADAEAAITLGTISTAYAIAIFSDYPILVRLNGPSSTQFTLTSSNVPATNVGAPLPANCCFIATCQVTSLRVAPITGASQTANVWICASGDPQSAYI